jgi:uncharacterized protein YbjT (DUF2867 family)
MNPNAQAVVVGATGELGAAIVARLRTAEIPVVAVARDRARLEQLSTIAVEAVLDEYRSHSPPGRMTTVDEVSWAVGQLLAPEAVALHGSTLAMDGGVTFSRREDK